MRRQEAKLKQTVRKNLKTAVTILSLIIITTGSTSCRTTTERDKKIVEVMTTQEDLLRKVRDQRSIPELKSKISEDYDLSAAEGHLVESIDALIKSSQKMIHCLQPNHKEENGDAK